MHSIFSSRIVHAWAVAFALGIPAHPAFAIAPKGDQTALAKLNCSAQLEERSIDFLRNYDQEKAKPYGALLGELSGCFRETAKQFGKNGKPILRAAIVLERSKGPLPAMEKAHREYLLAVQVAAASVQGRKIGIMPKGVSLK